ncbi:FAD binding domain-containing protein [Microvirga sp. STS02]|uniref:FAD binding domain-containing protein n=1 Tax=Hymenobacter negativus TaxID=2795026 RepID=UPI0018DDEF4C|nr:MULTISPECIES: FAD binding domain-containing protein [Bacteria]MBH8569242.1 FAD binding domain-containing protein [Hymenobacter negativus]MBR7208977.1 FAD binding domain-containing protein [Microvirga sp. STS02]
MNDFSYTAAATAREATGLLKDQPTASYLAGGTTLLDLMKANLLAPPHLVDVNPLPLTAIEQTPDGLRIGAMARMSAVGEHPLVVQGYPAVSKSLLLAASPQLRNMASIGGNLLQRTRCGYFRDAAFPCNKRVPGSGCPALEGDNHNLAVLGVSESCIATAYPGDLAVALAALDAVLTLENAKGKQRRVPITEFYLLPGRTPHKENVLEPGELIVAVTIPQAAHAQRSTYLKVRERSSYAYALASAAVGLDVQGGTIRTARVALGGVGAQPWRSREAEKVLTGQPATEATFRAAAAAALREAQPRKENTYKVDLAQSTLVRALQEVAG